MHRHPTTATPSAHLLWGRALILGAVALASGVLSHLAGGGRLPGAVSMTVLLLASVALASRFLRCRAGSWRLVLLVVAGQTLVHGLLSGLAGHRGSATEVTRAVPAVVPVPVPVETGRRTGTLYDVYAAGVPTPQTGDGGWLAHQVDHLTAQGPAMVLAHVGGAVALGLFLGVGESALWALLLLMPSRHDVARAAWRQVLVAADVRRGVMLSRLRIRAPRVQVRTSQLFDRAVVRRRGPPALLAA
jgi:hypothetical protein